MLYVCLKPTLMIDFPPQILSGVESCLFPTSKYIYVPQNIKAGDQITTGTSLINSLSVPVFSVSPLAHVLQAPLLSFSPFCPFSVDVSGCDIKTSDLRVDDQSFNIENNGEIVAVSAVQVEERGRTFSVLAPDSSGLKPVMEVRLVPSVDEKKEVRFCRIEALHTGCYWTFL